MKKGVTTLLIIFISLVTYGQKTFKIELEPDGLILHSSQFQIVKVSDVRKDQSNIGYVLKGALKNKKVAELQFGVEDSFTEYLRRSMKRNNEQVEVEMRIYKLEIKETLDDTYGEFGYCTLDVGYFYKELELYRNEVVTKYKGSDVTHHHDKNIGNAIHKSVQEFSRSDWRKYFEPNAVIDTVDDTEIDYVPNENNDDQAYFREVTLRDPKELPEKSEDRNVVAVGYQIGGLTAIGINYEIRLADHFGIHAGAGIYGYTAGIKIHTGDKKSSSFFNLSYKDGGFGLMSMGAIEFGDRIPFKKGKQFAFLFQVGFGSVIHIDPEFEREFFQGGAPNSLLSFGLGFSW